LSQIEPLFQFSANCDPLQPAHVQSSGCFEANYSAKRDEHGTGEQEVEVVRLGGLERARDSSGNKGRDDAEVESN
jgi:hypothetical protein